MGLPSGYKRLQYIKSTGAQYINTKYVPTGKCGISMSITPTSYASNACFFCSRDLAGSTDSKSYTAFYIASGAYRFDYYGKSMMSDEINAVGTNMEVYSGMGACVFGAINVAASSQSTTASTMPWILLASGTTASLTNIGNYMSALLYSCKIYDNGTLVRDFVPCTNSSNVAGLYDMVDGVFYASNTSTEFVAGPEYKAIKTGTILNYDYTGAAEFVDLPKGKYKLECWGAEGGYRSSSSYAGKGGYSFGKLTLSEKTRIYIRVGGSGNTGGTNGGFNGGGKRNTYNGGGGASDIRINEDSLYARVIVAGGGGSDGATNKKGMYGGGEEGGSTTENFGSGGYGGTRTGVSNTSWQTTTQSSNTTSESGAYAGFGFGGNGIYRSSGYGGAGGGGWYGGSGAYPDGSGDDDRGGGGGGGYIYIEETASDYPTGCLLTEDYYLTDADSLVGAESFKSPTGSTETGHSGNGYVRITAIKVQSLSMPVNVGGTWKDCDEAYVNIGGEWKAVEAVYVNVDGTWKECT